MTLYEKLTFYENGSLFFPPAVWAFIRWMESLFKMIAFYEKDSFFLLFYYGRIDMNQNMSSLYQSY